MNEKELDTFLKCLYFNAENNAEYDSSDWDGEDNWKWNEEALKLRNKGDEEEDKTAPEFDEASRLVHKSNRFLDQVRERMNKMPEVSDTERELAADITKTLF